VITDVVFLAGPLIDPEPESGSLRELKPLPEPDPLPVAIRLDKLELERVVLLEFAPLIPCPASVPGLGAAALAPREPTAKRIESFLAFEDAIGMLLLLALVVGEIVGTATTARSSRPLIGPIDGTID
jgi:hypothetical protein